MVKQKKTMKMKKIYIGVVLAMMLVALLALSFAGCGPKCDYTIGTVQVAPHSALKDAYNGFVETLTTLMEEKGKTVEFKFGNAHSDFSNNDTIVSNYVAHNVDLIYALGTPSAHAAKNATNTIPIIFNAVTDPLDPATKLLDNDKNPEGNITGCSDAAPVKEQLDLLASLVPEGKDVVIGTVYNKDETNSEIQIDQAKAYCEEKGWVFKAEAVSGNITDIDQCFIQLQGKITAMYLPTDNLMAENLETLRDNNKKYTKVPIVCAEAGMTKGCGIATYGLNYKRLGEIAGQMAFDILYNGKAIHDIPVQRQTDNFEKILVKENAEKIGYTIPQAILDEFEK